MSFDIMAKTASAVLDSIKGQGEGLVPMLRELVSRLHEIEQIIAETPDDGHTKNQTVREATAQGISNLEFLKAQQAYRDSYATLYESVWGEPEVGANNSEIISEAKDIAAKIKQGAMTLEKFFGESGFVNTLFAVLPKPQGASIRSGYLMEPKKK